MYHRIGGGAQVRYVHYYEQLLRSGPPRVYTYVVRHVRLITVPNFDVGGGWAAARARRRRARRLCRCVTPCAPQLRPVL